MARDQNLQEVFETVLYHRSIKESGAIARELHEAMMDFQEDQALNQIADERADGPFTAVDGDFFGIAKALDETRQAAAVLANDPNAREAITLSILGTKVDHAPGVDWSCHRAWSINKVRRLVQQALTDLSSAPSANPHSKHLEKPMAQSTTLPIDMKSRRFTVGECAGDTFETQGDYFGYAVTIEVKSKEEADAIQEILTKQRNAS